MSAPTANWSYPTAVRFGPGRIAELADALKVAGIARPLLVTDPGIAKLPMLGAVLANLGSIAAQRGDLESARTHLIGSARKFRDCRYFLGEASVLNNLGRLGLDQGNGRVALPMLQDALGSATRAGDAELIAIVQRNLAEAMWLAGDLAGADAMATTAQATFTAEGNEARRAECLRILGEIDEARGDRPRAVERWRAALAIGGTTPLERDRLEKRLREVEGG